MAVRRPNYRTKQAVFIQFIFIFILNLIISFNFSFYFSIYSYIISLASGIYFRLYCFCQQIQKSRRISFELPAFTQRLQLAVLAQVVSCLPLVQQVRGSFENFQPQGQEGWRCTLSNRQIVHHKPGLNSKPFRSIYVEKACSTVDSDSSVAQDRPVTSGGPLDALRAGTGFHLLPFFHHHPTQLNYTTQTLTHTVTLT